MSQPGDVRLSDIFGTPPPVRLQFQSQAYSQMGGIPPTSKKPLQFGATTSGPTTQFGAGSNNFG